MRADHLGDNWRVFLMRVALPDRPGSLGSIASVVGTVGGDIHAVEVVDRRDGYAIDDFMLELPPGAMPDELVSACTQVEGVRVLWFARYSEGEGLQADIETLERMTAEPDKAPEILTGAAPSVFHSEWALLVDRSSQQVSFASRMAPEFGDQSLAALGSLDELETRELAEGWLPDWGDAVIAITPLRNGQLSLIVGRHGGPSFLPSELARLRHLSAMIA